MPVAWCLRSALAFSSHATRMPYRTASRDERTVEVAAVRRLHVRRGQHVVLIQPDRADELVQCRQVEPEDISGRLAEHLARLAGRDVLGAEGRLDVIAGAVPPGTLAVRKVDADHHLVDTDAVPGLDLRPGEEG